ncbi:MAG: hypothetical protein K9L98_00430 [Candidatus Pacebacteria bacterium]|nr:hypothetical protein [Candidatus Paceibacterota bacterium]MCF7862464.1 hypothetical protein [Candidatus Paceibacterota bacterium]
MNLENPKKLHPDGVEQPKKVLMDPKKDPIAGNMAVDVAVQNIVVEQMGVIRDKLGMPPITEIPPSIQDQANLFLDQIKDKEFDYMFQNPNGEDTPEEYVTTLKNGVVQQYLDQNKDFQDLKPLLQNVYRGNYAIQASNIFFNNPLNTEKLKKILDSLIKNEDKKFSAIKNDETLKLLKKRVASSSRDSAEKDGVEYYSKTNQTREFFADGRKSDSYSYVSMMFGLLNNFSTTDLGKKYIHEKIDNKTIFLFGGGDSVRDLLNSEEFKPNKILNFDPFLEKEDLNKNQNGIYESYPISASNENIKIMVEKEVIPQADEVWATYSVPFYLDSAEDIKKLIKNMASIIREGGNARISPIAVQNKDKEGDTFETRKKALMEAIQDLLNDPKFNVVVFGDTIKIHKIKKEVSS